MKHARWLGAVLAAVAAVATSSLGAPAASAAGVASERPMVTSPVPLVACSWNFNEGVHPSDWECGDLFRSKGTGSFGRCFSVKPPTTPYVERLVGHTWTRVRVKIDISKVGGVWCESGFPWLVDVGPVLVYAQERGKVVQWRLVIPEGGGYRQHISTFGMCVTPAKTNYLHKCA